MKPHPIRIAVHENRPPWEGTAGGIASYVRHRAWVLGEKGFEVWWFNREQCACWSRQSKKWESLHSFRKGGPAARLNLQRAPVWRFLTGEVQVDIVELPDGAAIKLPDEGNRTPRIVIACHTSSITRAMLNRDKSPGSVYNRLRGKLRIDRRRTHRNLRRADGVIACSYEIALLEAGLFDVHPDVFTVIHHAFSPVAESGFRIRAEGPHEGYFLVVGNLEFVKGFDLTMAGFALYRRKGGKARLFFAGSPGFTDPNPQVKQMLSLPGAVKAFEEIGKESVCFLGKLPKDELAQLRARATAIVVGSRFEAFTMVAGESVLSGCPLILSNRTGWRGLAERYRAARLFDPYDPADLAGAMLEMENPKIRAEYQHNGDKLACYLTGDELAEKTANWYRCLAEGRLRHLDPG